MGNGTTVYVINGCRLVADRLYNYVHRTGLWDKSVYHATQPQIWTGSQLTSRACCAFCLEQGSRTAHVRTRRFIKNRKSYT